MTINDLILALQALPEEQKNQRFDFYIREEGNYHFACFDDIDKYTDLRDQTYINLQLVPISF